MRRLIPLLMLLLAPLAQAAGGGDEEPPSTYLELSPAFVVNVRNEENARSYAKAEVTLRFREAEARRKAEDHTPWLRHEIVMLISDRPAEELRTSEGQKELREAIRKAASERLLAEVPSLEEESGDDSGDDTSDGNGGNDDDSGEEGDSEESQEPEGPIREVLLPNFIVQTR